MKTLMKLTLMTLASLTLHAQAQQKLTCIYRAPVSGSTGDIVMEFNQDAYGNALGGRIRVQDAYGNETIVPIAKKAVADFAMTGPSFGAELVANVHVRSYDVDLVLNYVGNEFWVDTADWLGTEWGIRLRDMQTAYMDLLESGSIHHRMEGPLSPVAQMTGSVRWNGQIRKFASSQFVCSAVL